MVGKLFGVGICDAEYNVQIEEGRSEGKRKVVWRCPYYQTWLSLIRRCYSSKQQERSPTYAGCSVAEEWHYFSKFRFWMVNNPMHDVWVLSGSVKIDVDKDFIVPGNRVYSPEFCTLLPSSLNCLLSGSNEKKKDLPLGVYFKKENRAYQSQISLEGKKIYLGLYESPSCAHKAWQKQKLLSVMKEMEKYKKFIGHDQRVVDVVERIVQNLKEDIRLQRETTSLYNNRSANNG